MSDPRESLERAQPHDASSTPGTPAPAPSAELGGDSTTATTESSGERPGESTTATPDEWAPHVWPRDVPPVPRSRRGLSAAALACGTLGLILAVFGVWGTLLSLAAIPMALGARAGGPASGSLWRWALAAGLVGLGLCVLWILLITGALPMPGT